MRIAGVVVAALLLAACQQQPKAEPPPPRAVVWAHPERAGASDGVLFPGRVVASVETSLAFRVGGRIVSRLVDTGDVVRAGQALARLDAGDAQAQLIAAQAALARAKANAQLAEDELKRYQFLNQHDEVSDSALQQRQTQAEAARAQVQTARSQVELASNRRHYTTLTAPAAGIITQRLRDAGAVVVPGEPVFHFAEQGGREVEISVPEGQLAILEDARKLWVTLWAVQGKRFAAKLREVSPAADSATRSHTVRVAIVDANDAVRLGMSAAVLVAPTAGGPWFRVPLTAVEGARDKAQVWVVGDTDTVTPVPVQLQRLTGQDAIVEGALQTDSRIVVAGVELLVAGQKVRPFERKQQLSLP